MRIEVIHHFKQLIAIGGFILVVVYAFMDNMKTRRHMGIVNGVAFVLAVLAFGAFFDYGRYAPIPFYTNHHDFFHYYIGSKYSKEIGYTNLYPCVAVVDHENDSSLTRRTVRNQENYRRQDRISDIIRDKEKYKGLFTEERWNEFEKDVLLLRDRMGNNRWNRLLGDKGYNATPTWNFVARTITNALPPANVNAQRGLRLLDTVLAGVAFVLVWRAFGWRTMILGVIFFGTNYMMNQTHIKGSFLRMDWVTMMVMATCCLKLKYYKTAGGLMGYAACARIFPAVFLFGMGAKALYDFVKTKKIDPNYIRFFAAVAVVAGGLFILSVVGDRGFDRWLTYQRLISMHNDDTVEVRTGFKYVYLMTYDRPEDVSLYAYKDQKNQAFDDYWYVWWTIQAVVLIISFFAVRNLEHYETIPYGFVLAYFLVAPTFYYYVMLIVPFLLFAPKLDRLPRAVGLAALFAVSIASYTLVFAMNAWQGYTQFFWISVMLLAFVVYTVVMSLRVPPEEPLATA